MSKDGMVRLEGSQVSVAMRDGGRLDDCQLVAAPRGRSRNVWLFDGRIDVFVPVSEIVAVWETTPVAGRAA
jgi:hypothetical protein